MRPTHTGLKSGPQGDDTLIFVPTFGLISVASYVLECLEVLQPVGIDVNRLIPKDFPSEVFEYVSVAVRNRKSLLRRTFHN